MRAMETRTLFVLVVLFMLLNGGVLGLMHKSLSRDVQPSAVDWRIATLLLAGGWILLAVQDMAALGLILPLGNACLYAGMALYWRSMRRFFGQPGHPLMWLPVLAGSAGIYWLSAVAPSYAGRSMVFSVICAGYFLAAAWPCYRYGARDAASSSRVLTGIFVFIAVGALLRGIYFAFSPDAEASLVSMGPWHTMGTVVGVAILPVVGTTTFLVMCSERVSRQWEQAAATDFLTGLPNRRTIIGTGEARINAARRKKNGLALAVIDVDRFKSVNDRYGHDIGDGALKHVAAVLDRHCRGPHMVGRQGGEEFVALLEVAGADEARAAAERLRRALETHPFALGDDELLITISIGVAVLENDGQSLDDLLRRADEALYAAKSGGRNRVELR